MAFTWPEFAAPRRLDDLRSWTASFDSYDQYRENVYYRVRLYRGREQLRELVVKIDTTWCGDDWTVPSFLPELTRRIAACADEGESDT
jgi:hypothetical protein